MTKEGYLQIKIRKLQENISNLENQLSESKVEINKINKQINDTITKANESFKPLFNLDQQLETIEQHISHKIRELVDARLNNFEKETISLIKEISKGMNKRYEIKINNSILEIEEAIKKNQKNIHFRIDSLIKILNERGITNIDTFKVDDINEPKNIWKKIKGI